MAKNETGRTVFAAPTAGEDRGSSSQQPSICSTAESSQSQSYAGGFVYHDGGRGVCLGHVAGEAVAVLLDAGFPARLAAAEAAYDVQPLANRCEL
jgi:hypothetical protein